MTGTQSQQFMNWISRVHGADVAKEVERNVGDEVTLERLSAALEHVLARRQAGRKEGAEPSSDSDDLTFDNDFMVP